MFQLKIIKKNKVLLDDTLTNPFENIKFEGTDKERAEELKRREKNSKKNEEDANTFSECFVPWSWIETHCNLCAYSVDIKRCKNTSCCGPPRAEEAMDFLQNNNGFLPPVTKARDGHFMNPIHILQYCDLLKIPGYDADCPSIDKNMYSRLCCSVCQKYFPTLAFLTNHKRTAHPATRGRPKKDQVKQNSMILDDFSLLPSQQPEHIVPSNEIQLGLREYMSDGE
ncbi:hypothetical protein RhiirC2_710204 [Rhizophagus irregularis]|uniref:C2H2-type domain-containing protein n=1 Tax=Rhizophagus irregularis TaxID=588596 RepID=A0A2N1NFI8_9GLOM|nr:hypothetical protein RhiirC2_710204 [Rhizophagus irregularis]